MKQTPVVVLLTDFGSNDHYVATMKGMVISIAPRATIIDLSHSVEPQNINQAAFLLWSSYSYFPKGTLFVCVIDPGVGSARNILYAAIQGYHFLAPDNGLLKFVFSDHRPAKVIAVRNTKFFAKKISSTFHGRDIFAPVAAHLLRGLHPRKLGKVIVPEFGAVDFVKIHTVQKQPHKGSVLHIDHFGNIVTNFSLRKIPANCSLRIGVMTIKHFSRSYADAMHDKPFLIIGSSGLLEVSIRNGNAAKILHSFLNQKIQLFLK